MLVLLCSLDGVVPLMVEGTDKLRASLARSADAKKEVNIWRLFGHMTMVRPVHVP